MFCLILCHASLLFPCSQTVYGDLIVSHDEHGVYLSSSQPSDTTSASSYSPGSAALRTSPVPFATGYNQHSGLDTGTNTTTSDTGMGTQLSGSDTGTNSSSSSSSSSSSHQPESGLRRAFASASASSSGSGAWTGANTTATASATSSAVPQFISALFRHPNCCDLGTLLVCR
jgi:hypothetical protein